MSLDSAALYTSTAHRTRVEETGLDVVPSLIEVQRFEVVGHATTIQVMTGVEGHIEETAKGSIVVNVPDISDVDFTALSVEAPGRFRVP